MMTREDRTTTSEAAVLLVDSYARGISIGRVARQAVTSAPSPFSEGAQFALQLSTLNSGRTALALRSRYVMRNSDPLGDLERHLARLSSRGELRRTTVVFGVTTDPFHPFDEKFATSMRFLQLFERYVPGKLIIQTRSPLIVIGLPVLKQVRENTSVVVAIETPLDEIRRRYTPDLPSVSERWKTVRALKSFGFKVGVQVAPILPYGDWREGGVGFAEELASSADFVVLGCVADTASAGRAPAGELARRLTAERQFFWLRRDTARPLHEALVRMAPEKVYHPASVEIPDRQLVLFGG